MRTQSKFDTYRLLCHNTFTRKNENKKFRILLKFKKKFHKYLGTYMLHSKQRK